MEPDDPEQDGEQSASVRSQDPADPAPELLDKAKRTTRVAHIERSLEDVE